MKKPISSSKKDLQQESWFEKFVNQLSNASVADYNGIFSLLILFLLLALWPIGILLKLIKEKQA